MAILDYEDFRVRIIAEPMRGQGYPVEVLRAPAGELRLDQGIKMLLRADEPPLLTLLQAYRNSSGDKAVLRKIGSHLFRALFDESADTSKQRGLVNQLFSASLANVTKPSNDASNAKGLRLRLDIQALDLIDLPWELLVRAEKDEPFLAPAAATPVVRHLTATRYSMAPLKMAPPLKVLLILFDPSGPEGLAAVHATINKALGSLGKRVVISPLCNPTLDDIRKHILRGGNHVLHYAGPIRQNAEKEDCLPLSDDGETPRLNGELLSMHLQGSTIRLAVLNASGTAHGLAPAVIRAGVPAAVAMQADINSAEAECFAKSFYSVIGEGDPIESAVCYARMALLGQFGISAGNWAKPVLFMNSDTGRLFEMLTTDSNVPIRTPEEQREIDDINSAVSYWLARLRNVLDKRQSKSHQDIRDLLDEDAQVCRTRLRELKKDLIKLGAIEALPDIMFDTDKD